MRARKGVERLANAHAHLQNREDILFGLRRSRWYVREGGKKRARDPLK